MVYKMNIDKIIGGWLPESTINYPDYLSTVIFMSGCNLRCPYCINSEIILNKFNNTTFNEILYFIKKYDIKAAVITGGEPTIHPGKLFYIIEKLKKLDVKIKLDTNGLKPIIIKLSNPDYLALDFKTINYSYKLYNNIYEYCLQDLMNEIIYSLDIVKKYKNNAEVRITCCKPINDIDEIKYMCKFLSGIQNVYLQNYTITNTVLNPKGLKPFSRDELEESKYLISKIVPNCKIRNY